MVLKWYGDKVSEELKLAVSKGAYLTAEEILASAVSKAPRDKAVLRNSGTLTFEVPDGDSIYEKAKSGKVKFAKKPRKFRSKIYISFNTPYAYKQHEDTSLNHPKEGESKFLEKAWNEEIKNIDDNVKLFTKKAGLLWQFLSKI